MGLPVIPQKRARGQPWQATRTGQVDPLSIVIPWACQSSRRSGSVREPFQEVTHPETTLVQARLTLEFPPSVNLSINGQSRVPPGFRFHPTEEELLHYYLRKKVACENIDVDIIREVDLNKLEPWDIQEKCRIGSTPQNDWYFFSYKDRKYPTGTRTNRATAAGFWKATGRDKIIRSGARGIGLRKTLVFYKGRAPHGQKSDWIMHEYRLDDNSISNNEIQAEAMPEEGWVICRVFRKKSYIKTLVGSEIPSGASGEAKLHELSDGNGVILDQIFSYMGTTSKSENDSINKLNVVSSSANSNELLYSNGTPSGEILSSRFMYLPSLDSPLCPNDSNIKLTCYRYQPFDEVFLRPDESPFSADQHGRIRDWATLDRLVASQLDGQAADDPNMSIDLEPYDDEEMPFSSRTRMSRAEYHHDHDHHQDSFLNGRENDLWGSAKSTSQSSSSLDPLRYLLA